MFADENSFFDQPVTKEFVSFLRTSRRAVRDPGNSARTRYLWLRSDAFSCGSTLLVCGSRRAPAARAAPVGVDFLRLEKNTIFTPSLEAQSWITLSRRRSKPTTTPPV